MRILFFDGIDEVEANARAEAVARIDEWWVAFASQAASIDRHFSEGSEFDVPAFMARHLGAVDQRLMWEFGPGLRGARHRLVVTAETDRQLRPQVDLLLERAPSVAGWEFLGYRVPESLRGAEATVRGRTGRSLEGWRACVAASDEGGVDLTFWAQNPLRLADLAFWRRNRARAKDADAWSAAFVGAEALVGEETLLRWIDAIEVGGAPVPGARDVALENLSAAVEATIEERMAALPDRPLCEFGNDCAASERQGPQLVGHVMKLTPEDAADHPRRADLLVATTTQLPLWKRAHSPRPFTSRRYSRHGETFCYVKMDGSQGLDPSGFADKAEIEDALDEALRRERLGCTFGGGTGLRYSYVDLALLDVERAIPVLRSVLQTGKIPKRTWLQFLDAELASEWVRIWDDSPAPPGFEEKP